jgi:hypothetical protein
MAPHCRLARDALSRGATKPHFLHLKNESVRSALVVRGTALS